MKPLNILALSSWYPSDADPFLGNFVKRHCEAISAVHKVWVIFVAAVDEKSKERIEKTHSGNLTEIIIYQKPGRNDWVKYIQKRKVVLQMIEEIGIEFDIIHAHTLFSSAPLFSFVSKKLGIPWVFSEHWSGFHEKFRPVINPLKWKWIMDAGKTAKMGFPVSENLSASVQKVFPNLELRCVPNVVEDVFFQSLQNPEQHKKIRFLHVSTLVEVYKNMRGTLEAFSMLKKAGHDFGFLIVSDGDFSDAKKWTKEFDLTDRVDFKGPLSSDEIAKEMAPADALVLFSNTENQPCVVLESLSMGLPVIASAVGDIPNLVSDGKGFLAPPGDVNALHESLTKFIEIRSRFSRSEVAKGTQDRFSKEAVARMYSEAYANILNRD
ncbi:glycosyltransferase [Cryomorphaceae bacterium 1068]|nr:glycosyltransferase [Cryomorphaceae bacterium 1068]